MKKLQTHRGFTLIEMLISITLFMSFLGLVASSYTSLVSANRKAKEIQTLYNDVRFVFDTLASEIRSGAIDYTCIEREILDPLCLDNLNTPKQKVMAIVHENGKKRSMYTFDDAAKKILVLHQSRASNLLAWPPASWESLTSEKFPLENLNFQIFPLKNPYDAANASSDETQFQPSVTIFMKVKGFDFRTTYSSRTYGKQNIYE